jgi:biotin-dependent carboxylase-like uncharacterized protein
MLARGVAPAGPLDPEAFRAANRAVGNDPGAAAIEVPLGSLTIEARGVAATFSIDGSLSARLYDGDTLVVGTGESAVRYLAVAGGLDVPVVLGSRATYLAARMGGHLGRPLRRGDVLAIGGAGGNRHRSSERASEVPLVVDPGPHVDRFPPDAYEVLLASSWQVSRHGDRVGARLEGARVPREGPDLALPAPMIRGAIEVTTDGTPIVLGPDHPTTGGYPVLAVLRPASQAALARLWPGAWIRLTGG